MTVPAIHAVVEVAIERASEATGVDFSFLLGAARRESGYDPSARARTSSAAGLYQFVDQTWLATLKKYGAKYGYARYADLICEDQAGRYSVPIPQARQAVMSLRLDPRVSALMAGELATDHAAYLRDHMGRVPTAGELYAAHVLGSQGSARLFEAAQRSPALAARELFPEAAAANPKIFYRDGRPASVSEVYVALTRGGGPPLGGGSSARAGPVEYAVARRIAVRAPQHPVGSLLLRGPVGPEETGRGGEARPMISIDLPRLVAEARGRGRPS